MNTNDKLFIAEIKTPNDGWAVSGSAFKIDRLHDAQVAAEKELVDLYEAEGQFLSTAQRTAGVRHSEHGAFSIFDMNSIDDEGHPHTEPKVARASAFSDAMKAWLDDGGTRHLMQLRLIDGDSSGQPKFHLLQRFEARDVRTVLSEDLQDRVTHLLGAASELGEDIIGGDKPLGQPGTLSDLLATIDDIIIDIEPEELAANDKMGLRHWLRGRVVEGVVFPQLGVVDTTISATEGVSA